MNFIYHHRYFIDLAAYNMALRVLCLITLTLAHTQHTWETYSVVAIYLRAVVFLEDLRGFVSFLSCGRSSFSFVGFMASSGYPL